MTNDKKVWGIHTRDDTLFLEQNTIAVGWGAFGDLTHMEDDRKAFQEKFAQVYPEATKNCVALCAGMLYRFRFEMQIGDYVVYPSKTNRQINIGVVDGPYEYDASALYRPGEYINQRRVKWLKHLPRTVFSREALLESATGMSLFTIKNHAREFLSVLDTVSE